MGKGTFFVPAANGLGIERPGDPEGVELEGPAPSGPTPAAAPVSVGFTYGYSSCSPLGIVGTVKPLRVSLVKPLAYLGPVNQTVIFYKCIEYLT